MLTKIKERVVDAVPDARQQARRAKRQQIAECILREQKQQEQRGLIAASDRRVNEAVNTHASACQPIQERLNELEAAMLSAIADREEVKPAIGNERAKLLADLDEANRALEAVVSAEKSVRKSLTDQITQMQLGQPQRAVFEGELCKPPLCDPQLFAKCEALKFVLEHMRAAAESAKKLLDKNRDRAGDEKYFDDARATFSERAGVLSATVLMATGEVHRLQSKLDATWRAMRDE